MTARAAMGWTALLILTLMVLAGCTHEVIRYQSVPLPLPLLLDLPAVTDAELACIEEGARLRLEARQHQMREDLKACFSVICSTHDSEAQADCVSEAEE